MSQETIERIEQAITEHLRSIGQLENDEFITGWVFGVRSTAVDIPDSFSYLYSVGSGTSADVAIGIMHIVEGLILQTVLSTEEEEDT